MESIVVGMFDEADEAFAVVSDLEAKGVPPNHISVDTTVESDDKAAVLKERSFLQKVGDVLTGKDSRTFSEGVRRGSTVVTARVDEPLVDEVANVMKNHGAIDIDERSSEWREEGWRTQLTDYGDDDSTVRQNTANLTSGTATTGTATNINTNTQRRVDQTGESMTLPVVEEQLQVGKREVQRGGVRVYSRVTERPVEEQINLREEHVVVDRHPVNRPVTGNEPGLFQEGSFEVTERAEEVVVAKEARVVEEVVVGKNVSQHTETVRDTVRRTDVDVEQIQGQVQGQTTAIRDVDFQQYHTDFQEHYRTAYGSAGNPYDYYAPAYQYGGQLAGHDEFRGRSWNDIEPNIQRSWETRNPGTWAQFKDAIRYGWDRLTGQAPSRRY